MVPRSKTKDYNQYVELIQYMSRNFHNSNAVDIATFSLKNKNKNQQIDI